MKEFYSLTDHQPSALNSIDSSWLKRAYEAMDPVCRVISDLSNYAPLERIVEIPAAVGIMATSRATIVSTDRAVMEFPRRLWLRGERIVYRRRLKLLVRPWAYDYLGGFFINPIGFGYTVETFHDEWKKAMSSTIT